MFVIDKGGGIEPRPLWGDSPLHISIFVLRLQNGPIIKFFRFYQKIRSADFSGFFLHEFPADLKLTENLILKLSDQMQLVQNEVKFYQKSKHGASSIFYMNLQWHKD